MKTRIQSSLSRRAFTLLEMTIVIMMLLVLIGAGTLVVRGIDEWKMGRAASEKLRTVYSAQRLFLADNPTRQVSTLTDADLLPYMTGNPDSMPTVTSMDGVELGIVVSESPPFIDDGAGQPYDPSDSTTDLLWDLGE